MSIDTVRITGPEQVIDMIPTLVGFVPTDSVVLIFMEQGRLAVTIRVDLDGIDDGDWLVRVMDRVFPACPSPDVLSVVFADDARTRYPEGTPWARMLRVIGLRVRDDMWCDGTQGGSYLCDAPCCPFPVTLAGVPELDIARGETTARQTRDEYEATLQYVGPYEAEGRQVGVVGAVEALRQGSVDVTTWTPEQGATVLRYLRTSIAHRDWFIHLVSVSDIRVPAWLLVDLAQHAVEQSEVATLALLAYLAGDGAGARFLCDRSTASLARLVEQAVEAGMPPYEVRDLFATIDLPAILAAGGDPRTI